MAKLLAGYLSNKIMTKTPSSALSSIAFWCDAELYKIASFLCAKVLGMMSLQNYGGSVKEEVSASLERRNRGRVVKINR